MKTYRNMSIMERINLKSHLKGFEWCFAYKTFIEAAVFGTGLVESLFKQPKP